MAELDPQRPQVEPTASRPSSVLGPLFAATIGGLLLGAARWLPTMTLYRFARRPPDVSPALWMQVIGTRPWAFLSGSVLSALAAVVLVRFLVRDQPSRMFRLGLSSPLPRGSSWPSLLAAGAGAAALGIAASAGMSLLSKFSPARGGLQMPSVTPLWPSHFWGGIALAIVVAPLAALGEELLYRGYVQRGLVPRWPVLPAILLTAISSALSRGWPDAISAIPSTLFLGWVAYRTRSTRVSFVLHAAGNAFLYGFIQANGSWFGLFARLTNGTMLLLIVPGAAAVALGLRALGQSASTPVPEARLR